MARPSGDHELTRRDLLRHALGAAGLLAVPNASEAGTSSTLTSAFVDDDGGRTTASPATASTAAAFTDAAWKAERWIRSVRIETVDGVVWPADPNDPASVTTSLYTGTPGVVLFLLELHHATGDAAVLAEARKGADALIAVAGLLEQHQPVLRQRRRRRVLPLARPVVPGTRIRRGRATRRGRPARAGDRVG